MDIAKRKAIAESLYCLDRIEELEGLIRRGLTIGKAKSIYREQLSGVNLSLLPEFIASKSEMALYIGDRRQFVARAKMFYGMASAYLNWRIDEDF